MTHIRRLVVSLILAAAGVGSAGAAAAESLDGAYTARVTSSAGNYLNDPAPIWVVTPCGPGCVDVDAQSARLHDDGGRWAGTYELHAIDNGELVVCTRTITATLSATDVCPKPLGMLVTYQLTKNG
ncbi:hypothetical protein [Mycolicibacter minnesotensis]